MRRKPYLSADGVSVELADLEREANRMCREHWDVDYTGTIEVKRRRWVCHRGQFRFSVKDKSIQTIRMCADMNGGRTYEVILNTLLHELVHWWLWLTDQPSSDTDYEFITECLRVGASLSHSTSAQEAFNRYENRQRLIERGVKVI